MKLHYSLLLLVLIFAASCKKEAAIIKNVAQEQGLKSPEGSHTILRNASISMFAELSKKNASANLNSSKMSLGSGGMMSGGPLAGQLIGAVHIKTDSMWLGDQAGRTFKGYADEFTMLPEWLGQRDNFYLGSLIKGNTISSLEMTPLSERSGDYQSKPVSASISLPGKTVSGMLDPDELSTTQFYSKLLTNNGLVNPQRAAYSYSLQEFTFYDELRTVFGSNVKVNAIFVNSGTTSSNGVLKISKANGLVAKFMQKNFSLDMDNPESGELYENLNISALGGYWPGYISSITYGSTGIVVIESDENKEVLNNTFTKAFSVLGGLVSGTSDLSSSEIAIINSSVMKIYFVGPNGAEAVKQILSVDELLSFIKKGADFSAKTPGVPVSFKMKSLKDNKIINNNFKIDVPVENIFARIKFESADASNYNAYLEFFADQKASIPIIAPARITFKYMLENMRLTGSPRPGGPGTEISVTKYDLNNSEHLTRVFIGKKNRGNIRGHFYYALYNIDGYIRISPVNGVIARVPGLPAPI